MRAILIGILAALFFAVTFVFNHLMANEGGSWYFSSSFRFIFMLPFLWLIVVIKGKTGHVLKHISMYKSSWFIWSFFAFVLFYAPLTFAAEYSPGWVISGTWQITIICGMLLAPLFIDKVKVSGETILVRNKIPWRSLAISSIMFVGIIIIQIPQASKIHLNIFLLGFLPIIIAAFCYPLGNRKMMSVVKHDIGTIERVFGMTLVTMPVWFIIFGIGYIKHGLPSSNQVTQSFIVALFSGIIATVLFFYATNLVKDDQEKLAGVEATQSLEVVFAIIGEMILLGLPIPGPLSMLGVALIIIGMAIYSFIDSLPLKKPSKINV
ncbi:multidrug resistance efflux transporter family protein [Mammaliicoccus lentus]|uniref:DMT family transporter n=1 Tax=Mammaliicoccus lentus TaxID=42858 RepID=UPI0010722A9E|nr:multidrug resistance efflux transporter family protein [Mammaliicoccus lentus]MBF0748434.1 multidrug resistance efflux transporter family protein [Mammaliicoccus lentus]TFU58942.1 multidrug resistance efflux transporter family protein [Mammaliicoccus lentus]